MLFRLIGFPVAIHMYVIPYIVVIYGVSPELQPFGANGRQQLGDDVAHPFRGWIRGLPHLAPKMQAQVVST